MRVAVEGQWGSLIGEGTQRKGGHRVGTTWQGQGLGPAIAVTTPGVSPGCLLRMKYVFLPQPSL
jgi:hypothetical protein